MNVLTFKAFKAPNLLLIIGLLLLAAISCDPVHPPAPETAENEVISLADQLRLTPTSESEPTLPIRTPQE